MSESAPVSSDISPHCGETCGEKSSQKQDEQLHVVIIGSGSSAFACAIKAAEGGARVSIIEGADVIGGCCVNIGCVPSKILIRAAQLAEQQRNNPFVGLQNHAPKLDRSLLALQQTARVEELRGAKYQAILDANPALSLIKGWAKFKDANTLTVTRADGTEQTISADKILISTGSTPTIPALKGLADTPYWTSTEALFAEVLPQHLVVIGSSVVALELAQAYRRLGSQVTILARTRLLSREEPLLGEALADCFAEEGIRVLSYTQATQISHSEAMFSVKTNQETIQCDQLLVSTGRQANTASLNLSAAQIQTDKQGAICVDASMQTNVADVYAAGDCATMPQYVYVAAAAGRRVAMNMLGGAETLALDCMPAVIFTDPQVATVGLTEAQAQSQGIETDSRVLTMEKVPRALANFATDGFIKMVIETSTQRLIGVQVLAHEAGELIQTAVLAIHNKMTVQALAALLFPYLTMVEGLKLCAQTFDQDITQLSCCAG